MANTRQLIIADANYIRYKGDWITNTYYAINDVVTWSADGHLYQIIKEHTSSSSMDPDNAQYYKPMTNKAFNETVYDLTDGNSKANFFTAFNNMDIRPFVKIIGTVDSSIIEFSIVSASTSIIKLQGMNFANGTVYIYCITINASADNVCSKITVDSTAGTVSGSIVTLNSLTVTNMY